MGIRVSTSNPNDLLKELSINRNAEEQREPRKWGGVVVALILFIVICAIGVWYFKRDALMSVQVTHAIALKSSASGSVLDATGYVTARRMATVSSKVTGKVMEVLIEEGQRVALGDVMARLEPTDAKAQHALALAQEANARSQLATLQVQLKQANAQVKRNNDLLGQAYVSAARVEETIAQRDTLESQLQSAKHLLEVATRQTQIANNGLDNTIVRAPFSGVVISKAAQPGEIVSPLSAGGGFTRTGIGTLVDMSSLEIEVNVNEAYIGRVTPKMPVEAVLNAYPDWKIPAEVVAIIPTADRSKATIKVRIAIKSEDARIVPDMGVKVSFLEPKAAVKEENVMVGVRVPATVLQKQNGKVFAYVLGAENMVERRELTLGRTLGDDVQVISGLNGGETVVVSPSAELKAGTKVSVATPKA
ncbi:MAG: efflux RND transporter periplasmic adaptor subunit [Burkholderiales bacterium]|nr:efflux RND transporter periplasmic adaptor subunit [Burkholderiales bacterium]